MSEWVNKSTLDGFSSWLCISTLYPNSASWVLSFMDCFFGLSCSMDVSWVGKWRILERDHGDGLEWRWGILISQAASPDVHEVWLYLLTKDQRVLSTQLSPSLVPEAMPFLHHSGLVWIKLVTLTSARALHDPLWLPHILFTPLKTVPLLKSP